MSNLFDIDKIEEQLAKIKNLPPFKPEKYEQWFTATQLFETGIEVKIHFVIREGKQIFFGSEENKISSISNL